MGEDAATCVSAASISLRERCFDFLGIDPLMAAVEAHAKMAAGGAEVTAFKRPSLPASGDWGLFFWTAVGGPAWPGGWRAAVPAGSSRGRPRSNRFNWLMVK